MLSEKEVLGLGEMLGQLLGTWDGMRALRAGQRAEPGSAIDRQATQVALFITVAAVEQLLRGRSESLAKASPGEPIFVLRAQDRAAALSVLFWTLAVLTMQKEAMGIRDIETDAFQRVIADMSITAEDLRRHRAIHPEFLGDKLVQAVEIADAMDAWPVKKLAD